jgi:hypothetical protein
MSKGYTPKPWRPIPGSGQSLSLTSGTAATFANALGAAAFGAATYAFAIRLSPAATAYIATVTVTKAGTAATASTDYPISSSDYSQVIGCAPGDKVSVYQASGSTQTAYLCELT